MGMNAGDAVICRTCLEDETPPSRRQSQFFGEGTLRCVRCRKRFDYFDAEIDDPLQLLGADFDFCPSCGMELSGPNVHECPLCGRKFSHDDDDIEEEEVDSECDRCERALDFDELELFQTWEMFGEGEDGPFGWLCGRCFKQECENLYPQYRDSHLSFFVFYLTELLRRQSRRMPKHRTLDDFQEAVDTYVLQDGAVDFSASELLAWLKTEIPIESFIYWSDASRTPAESDRWFKAGVTVDYIDDWIRWEANPDQVRALIEKYEYEEEEPPPEDLLEYNISLEEAFQLYEAGLTWDYGVPDGAEGWLSSGLKPKEIVELVGELRPHIQTTSNRVRVRGENGEFWSGDDILEALESLRKLQMPISATTIRRYGGMSPEQILAAVDSPLQKPSAPKAVRSVPTPSGNAAHEIERIFDLTKLGYSIDDASALAKKGVSRLDVGELLRLGFDPDRLPRMFRQFPLVGVTDVIDCLHRGYSPDDMVRKVHARASRAQLESWKRCGLSLFVAWEWVNEGADLEEALLLARNGETPDAASLWRSSGLSAEEARQWIDCRFDKSEALKWIASGITDPLVAFQRRQAGISPQGKFGNVVEPKP
jgi:hypothetical protein